MGDEIYAQDYEKYGDISAIPALFEAEPYASMLLSDDFSIIGCNPAALDFFGYDSQKDFEAEWPFLIENSISAHKLGGKKPLSFEEMCKTALEEGVDEADADIFVRGKLKKVNITMKRVELVDSAAVAFYVHNQKLPEERLRIMIDSAPFASVIIDAKTRRVIECNMESVRLMGYSSKEEYIAKQDSIFSNVGSREFIREKLNAALTSGRETFEFTFMHMSGEEIPVEITIVTFEWYSSNVFTCYARDLRIEKQTASELEIHAKSLEAVNTVAGMLIKSDLSTFDKAIEESLKIIGLATTADRAYIWENFSKRGKTYCRQTYEWAERAEPQQGKDFTAAFDYDDMPLWKERLLISGLPINGPVTEENDEAGVLALQGIKSILILPIYYRGKPWGFIGFDDCSKKRVFSKAMEAVLHSGGILIVSSIERNRTMRSLLDATAKMQKQGKLLSASNEVASILLETEQDDFATSVCKALRALGLCVGADEVSIWENKRNEEGIFGSERIVGWISGEPCNAGSEKLFIDCDRYVPYWYDTRNDINKPFSEMDESLRRFPLLKDGVSFLLLPLSNRGEPWGFIEFLNKKEIYIYSDEEKNILRSSGMLIISAIIRNDITESLVEARESALASARSKSGFLSRMSHEIRTPINAIIGMTTLAKKSSDLEKMRHYLNTVESSSRQLLDIINDVLDMSKIDADKLEIINKEFDFEEMIRRVTNVVQVKLDEKKIDFKIEFAQIFKRRIISDELRLSQVLINLLGNAIKFTSDYGAIRLKVNETPLNESCSCIRIEVSDNGIGIEPDRLSKVFQSFEQADGSITRQYGGTGLGLAICKRIVGLMGGNIWAESEFKKGSRFITEITAEWGGIIHESSEKGQLRRDLRILAVDDEPEILAFFKETLAFFSLDCDTAEGGGKALEMVREREESGLPYDVVFVDWLMPEIDGYQTVRGINEISAGKTEIVVISSASWNEIEERAEAADVERFLMKPVFSSDLFNVLIHLTDRTDASGKPEQADGSEIWGGRHILLVEDNDINREIVLGILEETGVIIDCAENGLIGVEMFIAQPQKYELILMDVHMPVMDGLAATREIRSSGAPGAKNVPIIAMTADAFKEDEQVSFEAGMNGHISKPFDASELLTVLKKILG